MSFEDKKIEVKEKSIKIPFLMGFTVVIKFYFGGFVSLFLYMLI